MQFPRWIECEPGPIEQRTPGRGCSCDPLRAGFHAPTPIPRRVGFAITLHTEQKRYWFCNRGTSSNARRDALQLTYPGFQGFVCAKKPIDSSASRRTPPQGEPYNVRKMSATLRTQCGLETEQNQRQSRVSFLVGLYLQSRNIDRATHTGTGLQL